MKVGVRVEGARELRGALKGAGDGLGSMLARANKDAAQVVVTAALPSVPVRSGALRSSMRALGSQSRGRAVAGRASVPYAAAIHWGRKKGNVGSPPGNRLGRNRIKARPFLWDAARRNEARVAVEYEQMLRDIAQIIERV